MGLSTVFYQEAFDSFSTSHELHSQKNYFPEVINVKALGVVQRQQTRTWNIFYLDYHN